MRKDIVRTLTKRLYRAQWGTLSKNIGAEADLGVWNSRLWSKKDSKRRPSQFGLKPKILDKLLLHESMDLYYQNSMRRLLVAKSCILEQAEPQKVVSRARNIKFQFRETAFNGSKLIQDGKR